jgi:hypothetical protein
MNKSVMRSTRNISKLGLMLALFLATVVSAYGQKFEVTPLFGARFGGTIKLQPDSQPSTATATVQDSAAYGVAGGFRFGDYEGCEDCDLIEFRWMRQNTHLNLNNALFVNPLIVPSQPSVTFDHFLGDFTHEFPIEGSKKIRPFVRGTLGAARMSTPAGSGTRFVFGLGTGLKVFPTRHFGFRVEVEYLPMVMHAEVQRVVCAGGCIVTVNGGVMNQFQVSVGPAFRF